MLTAPDLVITGIIFFSAEFEFKNYKDSYRNVFGIFIPGYLNKDHLPTICHCLTFYGHYIFKRFCKYLAESSSEIITHNYGVYSKQIHLHKNRSFIGIINHQTTYMVGNVFCKI
jgi:hypothetical protein